MNRQEQLAEIIAGIRRSIPELNGVMVASVDGLSLSHDFPEAEADRVAAMAATTLGLGGRVSEHASLGAMEETVVRGGQGYIVVYSAGDSAALVMSGPSSSNLGLMRIEAKAASAQIDRALR